MKTKRFFACLMPFLVITVIFLTIYAGVQQLNRQSANDTPLQISEDMAALLNAGANPADVTAQLNAVRKVDLASSLAPFVAIYDASGTPVASQGALDGQLLAVPTGVFAAVDNAAKAGRTGESKVTLEPQPGVRIAAVITPYDQTKYGKGQGYVVAGKSLREVESRIGRIGLIILVGWLAAMIGWGIKAALMPRRDQNA